MKRESTLKDIVFREEYLLRFGRCCRRVKHMGNRQRRAVNATRLWNWADNQWSPETFWAMLRHYAPDRFCGPSANDHVFAYYAGDHYVGRMAEYLVSDGWPESEVKRVTQG